MAEKKQRLQHILLGDELDDALARRASASGVSKGAIVRAALQQYLGKPSETNNKIERVLARQTLFISLAVEAIAAKAGIKTDECVQLAKERVETLFMNKGN